MTYQRFKQLWKLRRRLRKAGFRATVRYLDSVVVK